MASSPRVKRDHHGEDPLLGDPLFGAIVAFAECVGVPSLVPTVPASESSILQCPQINQLVDTLGDAFQ